jgi:hypothetical protein
MPTTATSVPTGYHADQVAAQIGILTAPQKWNLHARVGEQEKDTFQAHEGSGQDSFVIAETHGGAGDGHVIHMRTASGYYQEGVRGTAAFTSNAQFEQRKYGQHGVVVGVHRHGSSMNEAVESEAVLDKEVKDGSALAHGEWVGRRKFEHAAITLRERLPASNRYVVGGRSLETLRSTDIFDRNAAIMANGLLKRYGGGRANAGNAISRQVLMRTLALCPSVALTKLKLDPAYQKAVGESMERGKGNPLFKGDAVDFDGCVFQEHDAFIHDGDGPVGSVLSPMGVLYGSRTTASSDALTSGVASGNGQIDLHFGPIADGETYYAKQFPGYNYVFQGTGAFGSSDTLGSPSTHYGTSPAAFPSFIHGSAGTTENIATGGEHYLMIVNPQTVGDGSYIPGGIGYYAYTVGNNGIRITITARLGQSAGGSSGTYRGRVNTLPSATALGYNGGTGIVTWASGIAKPNATYGGVQLDDVHPAGALVLPCNAKGVPFGWIQVLGGGALYRVYGKHRIKRGFDDEEDGFIGKGFVRSYFGHRPRVDRAGYGKAVSVLCALGIPDLNLPQVTA